MTRLLSHALTFAPVLGLSALLAGCAEITTRQPGMLDPRGSALVAVPLDATYEGERYPGSGQETAKLVATAFKRHLPHVEIMSGTAYSNSMDASGASRFDYLVMPSMVQWEDREVSRRDREHHVEISIRVVRTRDGATLASGNVRKPSKVSTAFGTSPVEQLEDEIYEYVDGLFGRR